MNDGHKLLRCSYDFVLSDKNDTWHYCNKGKCTWTPSEILQESQVFDNELKRLFKKRITTKAVQRLLNFQEYERSTDVYIQET